MNFIFTDTTQLDLEISSSTEIDSWQQSQSFSTPSSRWTAYLNRIILNTFLPWIEEEREETASIWPNQLDAMHLWSMVNGTVITMGTTRLLLLPTEAMDEDEFRVPQEWVDIPSFVADYYLAAQVNPDDRWVKIWGYTTHQELKINGSYDANDRSYCLDGDEMIRDLNVLWVARQLCPEEVTQVTVSSLPILSATQAENLVQRLGNPAIISPRLEVPFSFWGALLENETWRRNLYQQRQGNLQPQKIIINLNQWLENIFETGWQSLETLFAESENLAFSFRSTAELSQTQVKGVKVVDLGPTLEGQAVILMIGITPEEDERASIRIQLHPRDSIYLPANLQLSLLSESAEILRSVTVQSQDNYIQLPRFKCPYDFRFSVQISLDEFTFTEDFAL